MTKRHEPKADTKSEPTADRPEPMPHDDPPRNVYDGLRRAQTLVSHAAKDSRNDFHKYTYASAESMISACRAALATAGVMARRRSWRISEDGMFVLSTFEVALGATGETLTDADVPWAIVVERGKPVDKALAGALTTSLSYWLRDLLLLPREEEADMDRRNDKANPTVHGIAAGRKGSGEDLNATIRRNAESAKPARAEPKPDPKPEPQAQASDIRELAGFLHGFAERKSPADGRTFLIATIEADGVSTDYVLSSSVDGFDPNARRDWENAPVFARYQAREGRMGCIVSLRYNDEAEATKPARRDEGGENVLF